MFLSFNLHDDSHDFILQSFRKRRQDLHDTLTEGVGTHDESRWAFDPLEMANDIADKR